jgi:N utilization substance protein B
MAFQALYEMDLGHHSPSQVLERLSEGFGEASASPYPDEILREAINYAQELVRGVLANRTAIDGLIQLRAPLWPLAQMSAVDRNVLRIGLYESLYSNATVPLRTAINEAVELAKLFGSETSAKFVNGVLGRAVEASANGEWPPADSAPVSQSPESPGQAARTEEHPSGASEENIHPATPAG